MPAPAAAPRTSGPAAEPATPRQADEQQRHHDVEAEVEQHHLLVHRGSRCCSSTGPAAAAESRSRSADELEQQVADRQSPLAGTGLAVDSTASTPLPMLAPSTRPSATVVGTMPDAGQCRRQQHDRQARVRQHRQHRADDDVEHHLVGQRGQQRAHRRRLDQRLRRLDDELQRQQDQPEADQHAADPAERGLLARDEHHHADEDQQRRQPRQVEREHHRHHRAADVGAQHHGQRRRQRDQVLPRNEATIRQVAVLDWIRLVTPTPASTR